MKNWIFAVLLMMAASACAVAQNPTPIPTTPNNPTGIRCNPASVINYIPSGQLFTCNSGVYTASGGGGGGGGSISREATFSAGSSTQTITDSLGLSSPYLRSVSISPKSGSVCGSVVVNIGSFAANSFTATDSSGGTNTCDFVISGATPPPTDFSLSASATSGTSIFQQVGSGISQATYTVTQAASGGYVATTTLSCPGVPTGVTCTFSPTTISGSGTSTLTVWASYSATSSATGTGASNNFTVSATDGVLTHAVAGNVLGVWPGSVQQWLMNEGSSPMADSSGNPNNLVNTAASYSNISGLLSNTLTFNGTSTKSVASNHTNTAFNGSTAFSVCGWTYIAAGGPALVTTLIPASNYIGWEISTVGSPNNIQWFLINNFPSSAINVRYGVIGTGTAFHFCGTYNGNSLASGALMYVNGVNSAAISVLTDTLSGTIANTQNLQMGQRVDGSNTIALGSGIADVRIYNYVLNSTAVAALFAAGVK